MSLPIIEIETMEHAHMLRSALTIVVPDSNATHLISHMLSFSGNNGTIAYIRGLLHGPWDTFSTAQQKQIITQYTILRLGN